MLGHELAVEQLVAAGDEAGDQPGQCHLRGIGPVGEHAFPEEGAAELYPIEAARQLSVGPAFDRMGVA